LHALTSRYIKKYQTLVKPQRDSYNQIVAYGLNCAGIDLPNLGLTSQDLLKMTIKV